MPLYSTLASLSQTAASNAADGAVDAPSTIDQQTNLLASFIAQLRDGVGITYQTGDRNLVVNGDFSVNQRVYVSGTATTVANQVTLDRWRVVVSGQSITFGAGSPGRTVTVPAGGAEHVIEAGWIRGGVHTLSWTGTAAATVNGAAITSGGQTASLATNTSVTLRFSGGTVGEVQFERGSAATPKEYRPPATEALLCLRDYAKSYALTTTPGTNTLLGRFIGAGNVAGNMQYTVYLPVPMRVAPTVSVWDTNGNINTVLTISSAGANSIRSASGTTITDHSFEVLTALAGVDELMTGHWAAATGF